MRNGIKTVKQLIAATMLCSIVLLPSITRAQEAAGQIVNEALGVRLGATSRELAAMGFSSSDGKMWSRDAKGDFFPLHFVHVSGTIITSVTGYRTYSDVRQGSTLEFCKEDMDGLVQLVQQRYPSLRLRTDSFAERLSRSSNTHTSIVLLSRTPPPPGGKAHTDREIRIDCNSGKPGGRGLPALTISYSLSTAEQQPLWLAEERQRQSEGVQRLRSKGLRPEDF